MISVRSEVQILPGPPRPTDAWRRSCRPRQAQRQLRRERPGAEESFRPQPRLCAAASSAWLGVLSCSARLSRLLTQPLPPPIFERQGRPKIRGCSSVGRAPALQAGGHRFDSVHLHHRPNDAGRIVRVERGSGCAATARAPGAERTRRQSRCSSCTVRLSRLRGQPLAPPGAARAAPYGRVKTQCLLRAFELEARFLIFDR